MTQSNENNCSIDFSELTGNGKIRNISGHERGLRAREHFKLNSIEDDCEIITINIPPYIYAIGSSFIQGMFGDSLKKYHTDVLFFNKYKFISTPLILRQILIGLRFDRNR